MRRRRNSCAAIRVCQRGRTERYPSLRVNGDLYASNKVYRDSLQFAVAWKPDADIRDFVDLYVPEYYKNIKSNDIEFRFYYPRDYAELCEYVFEVYKVSKQQRDKILESQDLNLLLRIIDSTKEMGK